MASHLNEFSVTFQPLSKGKRLQSSAKVIILNVYIKLKNQNPSKSDNEVTEMCSNLTGVSRSSIHKIRAEKKTSGKLSTPGKKRPLSKNTRTRMQIYDEFTKFAIRKKVHSFFFKNEIPTAEKVMHLINEDEDLPNFSIRTVTNLMKDLGFVFKKRSRSSMLLEREDIVGWRHRYLRAIQRYRSEGKKIYYTDETWVNMGHTKERVWHDTTILSKKQAFLSGLSVGLKSPSGKGGRLIILHAGSEDGFVNNSLELFKAKKSGDYHDEMNGAHYEEWFVTKFLPNIQPNSIIVMDNAPYHSVHVEKIPTYSTRKNEIQAWLTEKNISWEEDMLKVELMKLVELNKKSYEAYKIDVIASQHGHTVLRLPPYHCELNPIELVWSQVKGYVAAKNQSFKIEEVIRLTNEGIQEASSCWANCVKHVIELERKMWLLDGLTENLVETVQFNVGNSSSDSQTCTDDDDNLSGIE